MRYPVTPVFALASVVSLGACQQSEPAEASREFVVRVANLTPAQSLYASGTFDTPDNELMSGMIGPEQSYSFDVVVHPGSQLQVITMFAESNDAFLAFAPGGITMWTLDGEPIEGERTDALVLYDAGTERNEPLGEGASQPLRQGEPDTGEAEDGRVSVISDAESGASTGPGDIEFPAIESFAELHVIHLGGSDFRVVIRNVSPDNLLARPAHGTKNGGVPAMLSPGVYSVHEPGVKWFEIGQRATPQLERLVEDGDAQPLGEQLDYLQGVASDFSGVVWAVHDGDVSLCNVGSPASVGLEDLVENAEPEQLVDELAINEAVHVYGLARPRNSPVLEPGEDIEFRFMARPGAHLGLAIGYLATNDKFLGACGVGIPLFEQDGVPRTGELAWAVELFDAGTELDEPPGLGRNQFERQSRSGSGDDEGQVVREVRGRWMGWEYAPPEQIVSVEVDVSSTIPALPDDGFPNFP